MSIQLKSKADIEVMRQAGLIVHSILQELAGMVKPGVTTRDIDTRASELTAKFGAKPAFLGYRSSSPDVEPFPGVICAGDLPFPGGFA